MVEEPSAAAAVDEVSTSSSARIATPPEQPPLLSGPWDHSRRPPPNRRRLLLRPRSVEVRRRQYHLRMTCGRPSPGDGLGMGMMGREGAVLVPMRIRHGVYKRNTPLLLNLLAYFMTVDEVVCGDVCDRCC